MISVCRLKFVFKMPHYYPDFKIFHILSLTNKQHHFLQEVFDSVIKHECKAGQ